MTVHCQFNPQQPFNMPLTHNTALNEQVAAAMALVPNCCCFSYTVYSDCWLERLRCLTALVGAVCSHAVYCGSSLPLDIRHAAANMGWYCRVCESLCQGLEGATCCQELFLSQQEMWDIVCSCEPGSIVTASTKVKTNRRVDAYPEDPLSRMYKVTRTRIGRSTVFCNFAISVGWID